MSGDGRSVTRTPLTVGQMKFDEEMGEPGTKTYRFNTWAKRHPVLFWGLLLTLVAIGLTFRFLRHAALVN